MKEDKGVLITIIVLLVIFLPLTILGYIEHNKMENNYEHKLYYQGYLWFYDNDKLIGKIEEYRNDNGNKMIKVSGKYIPYNKDFITKIDKKNNAIYFHGIEVFL